MFGSHLSISGGMHNAILSAEKLGMETVQVFTKNQQQWAAKPLADDAVAAWKAELKRVKLGRTVAHDSYLINLGSPDDALWEKSTAAFVHEIERCEQLGIHYLVTHPGAHNGSGEDAGLKRVAAALDQVFAHLPDGKTVVCLEATAGQGTSLGYKLEHLAELIERSKHPKRLAVCLDTAHLFAAGYDFRGRKYAAFRKVLDRTVGVKKVKVLHLNDSKKDLGSRVDRHEHIGRGTIGLDGFKPIVRDEAWLGVPKILETEKGASPEGEEWDLVNIRALKSLMKS
jgi:deoxyribonuclease-4